QMLERRRHLFANNVGAGRQHLTQLDVGGTQTLEGYGQAAARIRPAFAEIPQPRPHHPGGLNQAQETPDHTHQSRQAECMATMPPESGRTFTCPRPASAIMAANFSRVGKRRMLSAR